MKKNLILASLSASLLAVFAIGCSKGEDPAANAAAPASNTIAPTNSASGQTPGAQQLGIQENPNGTNPGLGSK